MCVYFFTNLKIEYNMEDIRYATDKDLLSNIMRCSVDKADELLKYYGNNIAELSDHLGYPSIEGITPRMKKSLLACFELGRRIEKQKQLDILSQTTISSSEAIFAHFNHDLSALDHEELWALYLSKNGKVLAKKQISIGSVDAACADLRRITLPAIEYMASYVALCHNHPHSSIIPSKSDKAITSKVKEALALFDVRLVDHLIISDGQYYSFADEGEIG